MVPGGDEPDAGGPREPSAGGIRRAMERGEELGYSGQRFLLALSIVLLVVATTIVWPYRGTVLFALLFGFLLHPAYAWLRPRVRWGELASAIILLLVAVAMVVPVTVVGYFLVQEVAAVASGMEENDVESAVVEALVELGVPREQVQPLVTRATEAAVGFLEEAIVPALTAVTEFVFALVVFFILLFFILRDGQDLVAFVRRVMPLDVVRRDRLLARMGDQVKGIMLGTFFVSLIQGVAATLGWWVLGFPAPILWGAVMTVLAVVPFLGPFLVLLPAGAIAIIQGDTFSGVALIGWALVLVGLVDDVIRPYVIGKRTRVHAAVILVGIVGGIYVFGVTGIVLGPLILSLLGPVLEAWSRPEDEPLVAPDEREDGGEDDEDVGGEDGTRDARDE